MLNPDIYIYWVFMENSFESYCNMPVYQINFFSLFFHSSTKKWPLLYPLHINTKFASENGDKSVFLFKFEEKKNYINVNNTRNQNFSIHFGYPGKTHMIQCATFKKSN